MPHEVWNVEIADVGIFASYTQGIHTMAKSSGGENVELVGNDLLLGRNGSENKVDYITEFMRIFEGGES